MAFDPIVNFGYTTVAVAPSPANSGLSLEVADPSVLPDPDVDGAFNVVVWDAGSGLPLVSNAEIVRVTAEAAGVFTIARTQENTPVARSILVGDQVAAAATAKTFTDLQAGGGFQIGSSYLRATSSASGLSGAGAGAPFAWTLDDVDGSDLSINGGDTTLIDVATAGWYVISHSCQFQSDGAEVFSYASIEATTDPDEFTPYWPQYAGAGTLLSRVTVTSPPVSIGAAGQITTDFQAALVGGTGTFSVVGGVLEIVRVS